MGNQQCCGGHHARGNFDDLSISSILSQSELQEEIEAELQAPTGETMSAKDLAEMTSFALSGSAPKITKGSRSLDSSSILSNDSKQSLFSKSSLSVEISTPKPILKRSKKKRKHRRSVTFGSISFKNIPARTPEQISAAGL
mmetsp:Transcript_3397/g.4921  ORF Transcript_3397/g.4921 Transcript_3397/m.4921 type:complete len:141 (+) Transcript_3397:187-609(+)